MANIEAIRPLAAEVLERGQLVFATSSGEKAAELEAIFRTLAPDLNLSIVARNIEMMEPQPLNKASLASGLAVVKISQYKVLEAYLKEEVPVLGEDSSWGMPELKGYPGPLIKWALHGLGNEGLCRMADRTVNRKVVATSVFSVAFGPFPDLVYSARGDSWGWVADHPRGNKGFGFDSDHIPGEQFIDHPEKGQITLHQMLELGLIKEAGIPATIRTYAQMEQWEKNRISMRMLAIKGLADFFRLILAD